MLTRSLQDLLDLADSSLLLLIKVLHSDGVAQLWRWGLQNTKQDKSTETIRGINGIRDVEPPGDGVCPTRETLSSLWLGTNWIFRFLFPPLPVESTEAVTGTLGAGANSAATSQSGDETNQQFRVHTIKRLQLKSLKKFLYDKNKDKLKPLKSN